MHNNHGKIKDVEGKDTEVPNKVKILQSRINVISNFLGRKHINVTYLLIRGKKESGVIPLDFHNTFLT